MMLPTKGEFGTIRELSTLQDGRLSLLIESERCGFTFHWGVLLHDHDLNALMDAYLTFCAQAARWATEAEELRRFATWLIPDKEWDAVRPDDIADEFELGDGILVPVPSLELTDKSDDGEFVQLELSSPPDEDGFELELTGLNGPDYLSTSENLRFSQVRDDLERSVADLLEGLPETPLAERVESWLRFHSCLNNE